MTQIDLSAFPKYGSMIFGGGLSAIFDPSLSTGYAEGPIGFVGVDMRSNPQSIDKIVLRSASNGWDASGDQGGAVRFRLYVKQGPPPTTPFEGELIGRSGPIRDVNGHLEHSVYGEDWFTKWDQAWIVLETPVWTVLSGFEAFAPVVPQIGAERRILRRRSDSSQPISKSGSLIPGMRFLFELTQPAAVIPLIKIEIEHQFWATGMSYVLSCGCYLYHRQGDDLQELASASFSELDVSGRNLNLETHYERHEPRDAVNLSAGFHEIIPSLNADTYQASSDWYAGVLVEYGRGLNKGILDIDPNAVVINV
jgi:hypothetical protein